MTHHAILLAGGGSGGHIAPGLAIAEALGAIAPDVACHFACSARAIDARLLGAAGVPAHPLPAVPPSVRPAQLARFLVRHRRSLRRVTTLLATHDITHVVALGGFVAVPAVGAARRAGIGTTLLNLDVVPGRANRWLARRVDRYWSAMPVDGTPRPERLVPFPVRTAAIADGGPDDCRRRLGLVPDRPTLLVTGASQGAASLNDLLPTLATRDQAAFAGWQVLHLAGPDRAGDVRDAYERAAVSAVVLDFLDTMGDAWGAADLAVSRAGANSVAEAAVNAVPTVFLPYPYHRDQHQRRNAALLADHGAARVVTDHVDVDANVRSVGPVLRELMTAQDGREAMRAALIRRRPADGADAVATQLLELLTGRDPVSNAVTTRA